MRISEFRRIVSSDRFDRYESACKGDTRKAMTLYRYNLALSQNTFSIISCFEIALRNAIDNEMKNKHGNNWLRNFVQPNGVLDNTKCQRTAKIIKKAYNNLLSHKAYSHQKLIAEMEFGIWKYMFSTPQFIRSGAVALQAFPSKPKSTPAQAIDNSYIYNELDGINLLRNRIAHHEPICFDKNTPTISTTHVKSIRQRIYTLFEWMEIDASDYLYGLDHIQRTCDKIDNLI